MSHRAKRELLAQVAPRCQEADRAQKPIILYPLTLTEVAAAWTECLPLHCCTQLAVVAALHQARELLPFPLPGLDTDNGSEFLNAELVAYCAHEHVTFTRGRTANKNDQCFLEQKAAV